MPQLPEITSPTGQRDFLSAYRSALISRYEWARTDKDKLDRFLAECKATLDGAAAWNHVGEAVTAAWVSIGGRNKPPSLKALRALRR